MLVVCALQVGAESVHAGWEGSEGGGQGGCQNPIDEPISAREKCILRLKKSGSKHWQAGLGTAGSGTGRVPNG